VPGATDRPLAPSRKNRPRNPDALLGRRNYRNGGLPKRGGHPHGHLRPRPGCHLGTSVLPTSTRVGILLAPQALLDEPTQRDGRVGHESDCGRGSDIVVGRPMTGRSTATSDRPPPRIRLRGLSGSARSGVLPILKESFTGYYRWHAKRTLLEIERVQVATLNRTIAGAALLERLVPEVGYISYIFVGSGFRRRGVGAALFDDAIRKFRRQRVLVVYAVAEPENRASIALIRSRGFRRTERKETSWKEGGLGAWGLRSRMRIIGDEVLFGLRLDTPIGRRSAPARADGFKGRRDTGGR
jgi:ribosomal protein S18 acetylase RimI-like enzyme